MVLNPHLTLPRTIPYLHNNFLNSLLKFDFNKLSDNVRKSTLLECRDTHHTIIILFQWLNCLTCPSYGLWESQLTKRRRIPISDPLNNINDGFIGKILLGKSVTGGILLLMHIFLLHIVMLHR